MLSFYWTVFLWRGKNNKRFASSEITHLCYRSICWQKSCTLLGARILLIIQNKIFCPLYKQYYWDLHTRSDKDSTYLLQIPSVALERYKEFTPYLRCYIDSWTRKFGTMTQQWKMIEIFASLPDISFYIRCSGHEPQTPLFVWV